MSTIQEIEAATPRLKREEIEALRSWIEDHLEGQRTLRGEVTQQINPSRGEIAAGEYTTRRVS